MFTKIEHANDENEQKDEAAFIFKPVSVEACRCGGGKALSTASFPQTHRKNATQAVPISVVSVSAFRVVGSDEHFCQCTMREEQSCILWLDV